MDSLLVSSGDLLLNEKEMHMCGFVDLRSMVCCMTRDGYRRLFGCCVVVW
jgi:hypothetical protein